jgi:uncharacterized protein YdaU (DUF1376 family)
MSQAPSMPVFTDALIGDTTHLSMEEFGAYLMILFVTWRNNGQPLPDDDKRLARICRMSEKKWSAIRPTISEFFDLSEGVWRQKRLEKEWKYVSEQRAKQSEKGKKSAQARSLKNNETPPAAVAQRLEPQGQPNVNPQPQPHTEEKKEIDKSISSPPSGGGKRFSEHPDFQEWYSQYPRKEDRKSAAKAYASARKDGATKEGLLAAVMRYAAECGAKGTERQYIKHPTTWLNKGSWQNEPDLITLNRGKQNVLQLDLARTYQQQPDIRRRAILAAMPELNGSADELDNGRAGAF